MSESRIGSLLDRARDPADVKLHAATAIAAAAGLLVPASGAAARPPAHAVERARDQLEQRLGPGVLLRADGRGGTVRSVGRLGGPLTAVTPEPPAQVALHFVRVNRTALGLDAADVESLQLTRGPVTAGDLVQLGWGQSVDGLRVARTGLRATFDRAGRLRALAGRLLADVTLATIEPAVPAAEAYRRVRGGAPAIAQRSGGRERATVFRDGGSASLVAARAGGRDRLAWRVLAPVDSRHFYDALVDAASGVVVEKFNRVRNAGQFAHFDYHPDTPPIDEQAVEAAPSGWIAGPVEGSPLSGPNVHAVADPKDRIEVTSSAVPPYYVEPGIGDAVEEPADANGDWVRQLGAAADGSTWNPDVRDSWADNENHSAAQLFWFVNRFHDHLAATPISFDAAAGAFQGSDPIIAQTMDGASGPGGSPDDDHVSNANFLTLPDGSHGYMQIYLFDDRFAEFPFAIVDGADDASIVYHEYAHGLSGRLVTYSDGWDAMWNPAADGGQAGALGEGTSDWYSLDYLVGAGLITDTAAAGDVRVGEYVDPDNKGTLRFEGVDCSVGGSCPGTADAGPGGFDYGDYGSVWSTPEVHSDGEIWAQTLWDLRKALVAAHGADGVARARRYVTGGLRLAPPEPDFLDMRDALLQAAALNGGSADVGLLRSVFAARGMGWSAAVGANDAAIPGFDLVPPGAVTGAASAIGQTTATVSGTIDPAGTPTSYRFQYGISTAYGSTSEPTPAGAGAAIPVAAALLRLAPGTTYHYRLVAVRSTRTVAGADRTFTTAPLPQLPPIEDPPSGAGARIAASALIADRRGRFKVRVTFADDAPLGRARLTVLRRGRTLAAKSLDVGGGGSVKVPMRLSRAGRRAIRHGRSRLVTLRLRVSNGASVRETVRLRRR